MANKTETRVETDRATVTRQVVSSERQSSSESTGQTQVNSQRGNASTRSSSGKTTQTRKAHTDRQVRAAVTNRTESVENPSTQTTTRTQQGYTRTSTVKAVAQNQVSYEDIGMQIAFTIKLTGGLAAGSC